MHIFAGSIFLLLLIRSHVTSMHSLGQNSHKSSFLFTHATAGRNSAELKRETLAYLCHPFWKKKEGFFTEESDGVDSIHIFCCEGDITKDLSEVIPTDSQLKKLQHKVFTVVNNLQDQRQKIIMIMMIRLQKLQYQVFSII